MNRYLLFSFQCYYPSGGMDDCILVSESLEELNEYAKKCVGDRYYSDDFLEYYDCQNNELYRADCVLLKQGIIKWELDKKEEWDYGNRNIPNNTRKER